MNLRSFIVAMLFLVISQCLLASNFSLSREDFISAKSFDVKNKHLISAKLSPSGLNKFKNLNVAKVGKEVTLLFAHQEFKLKLRVPIKGDTLEFGPFSNESAQQIVSEINGR